VPFVRYLVMYTLTAVTQSILNRFGRFQERWKRKKSAHLYMIKAKRYGRQNKQKRKTTSHRQTAKFDKPKWIYKEATCLVRYVIAHLSVYPSNTQVKQSNTGGVRITNFSPHGRTTLLVFCAVCFIQKFLHVPQLGYTVPIALDVLENITLTYII